MNIFKWKPDLKPKFPNILEKFFGKDITHEAKNGEDVSTVPAVNISDANKAFEVNLALPGLEKKDVKIEIQNNCLSISSEKQYEKEDKEKNWVRREYGYASFQRMFELPESADHEKIQADLENGILFIKIAKKPGYESKIKQISIQ